MIACRGGFVNIAAGIEKSLDEAQKWAASVGYEENDVNDIIKSVRKRGRAI